MLVKKGVPEKDILISTAEERKKGGEKHRQQVMKWKRAGDDAVLLIIATQPIAGMNHYRRSLVDVDSVEMDRRCSRPPMGR